MCCNAFHIYLMKYSPTFIHAMLLISHSCNTQNILYLHYTWLSNSTPLVHK